MVCTEDKVFIKIFNPIITYKLRKLISEFPGKG